MEKLWYQLPQETVVTDLESDAKKGLSPDEAARRLAANGPNELKEKPRATLMERIIGTVQRFSDPYTYRCQHSVRFCR